MTTIKRPQEITIVGAGLVGSLLAVLLGNLGYRVVVFEKRGDLRQQPVEAGRSINLALAERGIHALRLARLMHDIQPMLIPMRGRLLHDWNGELDFWPYGQRSDEVIYSVSRSGLNAQMMTAAETSCQVEIRFGFQLESINVQDQSVTLLNLATGKRMVHRYEILIGADGAGSRVRRAMLPSVNGWDRSQLLDHDYKELTIPAAPGGENQLEKEALHIWPRGGFMLIALPNLDGSFTVTLFLNKEGDPSFANLVDDESVQRFFQAQFPDVVGLLPNLADQFFRKPTGILGTVRCAPWIWKDSTLLIGDAAHAIVPFHGQGMNAGFEDCRIFVQMLESFQHDWPVCMREFDRLRPQDTEAIANMALENYVTMRDSVRDPQFQLKKELGFELERRFPDQFVPRYSMVMFHHIPYSDAYARGKIQEEILDALIAGRKNQSEVDYRLADELIRSRLSTINDSSRISSSTDDGTAK